MNDLRIVMVCGVCGRFRQYDPADEHCIVCGYDQLSAECECGRSLDYALSEPEGRPLFCPRCGKDWRSPRSAL